MRYTFIIEGVVHDITLTSTMNQKLGLNRRVIGTYHFDIDQVLTGDLTLDTRNCLDCSKSYNSGDGKCYTHKGRQRLGLLSKLCWIKSNLEFISEFDLDYWKNFVSLLDKSYPENIRFGVYGEPSLLPNVIIEDLTKLGVGWQGYTQQWHKRPDLSSVFQASTHSEIEARVAESLGWRVFNTGYLEGAVNCPASKEAGYKTSCTVCNLCSGTSGKGNKNIYINPH